MAKQLEPTRKLKKPDGTIMYIWNNKLHNWEGPALIPGDKKEKPEYYLFGIKHTKEKWEEKKKDVEGVPWHKTSLGKSSGART